MSASNKHLNLIISFLICNIWSSICDHACLLNQDDFIFDYRGILFEEVPNIFNCDNKNVLPSDNLHVEGI